MKLETNQSPTFEEIAVIEKATNGLIKTHEWWVVKGAEDNFKTNRKPANEQDIVYHGVLENSFVSKSGEYIGGFDRAQWYQKHRLKVYEPYASGVAESYNENGQLEGYCGYTHRGAQIMRIGDRLFEETYEPKQEHYTQEQWQGWVNDYYDSLAEAEAEGNQFWIQNIKEDGISACIPFKMRGSKVIETFEEAAQAAINLSKHLS